MVSLPRMTAPASTSFVAIGESSVGHVVGEHLRAARHPHAGDRDQVFEGDRDAVERPSALTPRKLGVSAAGLLQGQVRRDA